MSHMMMMWHTRRCCLGGSACQGCLAGHREVVHRMRARLHQAEVVVAYQ